MKTYRILILLSANAVAWMSTAQAQEAIPVHIRPDPAATVIGSLEALPMAVAAEWPSNAKPVPGWNPIYFQGSFEAYVKSGDFTKDLRPKPGAAYYLSPKEDALQLAIATKEDKTELISVSPRYTHLEVSTIVLGYIEETEESAITDATPEQVEAVEENLTAAEGEMPVEIGELQPAEPIEEVASNDTAETDNSSESKMETAPPAEISGRAEVAHPTESEQPGEPEQPTEAAPPIEVAQPTQAEPVRNNLPLKTVAGILVRTSIFEKRRSGYTYKVVNSDNTLLAFLDPVDLPKFQDVASYANARVEVTGRLSEDQSSNELTLKANYLKRTN